MKRILWWLHRYVGLASALVLFLVGLSGSALIFRPELETISGVRPAAAVQAPNYQHLLDVVQARYPQASLNLRFSEVENGAVLARIKLAGGERRLWIDPLTVNVVSDQAHDQGGFNWLFELHENFTFGESGEWLTGLAGGMLVLLGVSGVILWWPKSWQRIWRLRRDLNRHALIVDLHRLIGASLSLLLIISGLSGCLLTFAKPVNSWINTAFGVTAPKPLKVKPSFAARLALDELVARANQALPGGRLVDIRVLNQPDRPVVIRKRLPGEVHPNGRSQIELDPYSGRVLRKTPYTEAMPAMKLNAWVYAFHIGQWGGITHRLMLLFSGIGLMFLAGSGLYQWIARR